MDSRRHSRLFEHGFETCPRTLRGAILLLFTTLQNMAEPQAMMDIEILICVCVYIYIYMYMYIYIIYYIVQHYRL